MRSSAPDAPDSVKILIAGGFGVGKTTFVGSVSEVDPLSTEAPLTAASEQVDDISKVAGKTTTTVAMDFGRITLDRIVLYLFGTPGQDRFWFMWDDLVRGAIGAIVLADTRRIEDSFAAVDFFEERATPFIVGLNQFPDAFSYSDDAVRDSLELRPDTPVVRLDALDKKSCRDALVALIQHRLGPSMTTTERAGHQ
ncbi:ATP/GTP-binding protein [Streptomyces sp. DSM 44918]|uniref:ATP/GTP-binding protein n=2 Tax=Streptomyces millisiae TaxID=3075542 RepID=A0ABU2LWB9_9ACTN|nr:ATP/GTP-binding protein [Streptomyces sp. DSM 44918]MDT0321889.1 ATP/GTP-binding protein [Streptomyces sp. DSM 44918]